MSTPADQTQMAAPARELEHPRTTPQQPTSEHDLAQMLAEQRALTQLGLLDLHTRLREQPDLHPLTFGPGLPNEQTVRGFPENIFRGVAIYNSTSRSFRIGFNASAALGSTIKVEPGSLLVWPANYQNLNVLSETMEGPLEILGVLRLRYPPAQPGLHQLSSQTGGEGPEGPEGPTGPIGERGPAGEPGPDGPVGPEGPKGTIGPEGAKGETGPEGAKGETGPEGKPPPVEAWKLVEAFTNNWKNYGPTRLAEYRKTPFGIIELRGTVGGGTAGTAAFTLPEGYRPPVYLNLLAVCSAGIAMVSVPETGAVVLSNLYGTAAGTFTYLEAVRFSST
jgi:hypothetical protein